MFLNRVEEKIEKKTLTYFVGRSRRVEYDRNTPVDRTRSFNTQNDLYCIYNNRISSQNVFKIFIFFFSSLNLNSFHTGSQLVSRKSFFLCSLFLSRPLLLFSAAIKFFFFFLFYKVTKISFWFLSFFFYYTTKSNIMSCDKSPNRKSLHTHTNKFYMLCCFVAARFSLFTHIDFEWYRKRNIAKH